MNTAAIQHPHRKTPAELLRLIDNVEIATANDQALTNARQQHHNALQRAAASEGHASAQRISNYLNNTTMTQDPYRLDTSRVIPIVRDIVAAPRASATQPTSECECTFGECHLDPNCNYTCPDKPKAQSTSARQQNPNCGPGVCEGKATCTDHQCQGHPCHTSNGFNREIARWNADMHKTNGIGNAIALGAIGLAAIYALFFFVIG